MDSLKKLGIDATFRIIDASQYINRYQNFDYDVFRRVPTLQSISRQRAARILVNSRRRPAGVAQHGWHSRTLSSTNWLSGSYLPRDRENRLLW